MFRLSSTIFTFFLFAFFCFFLFSFFSLAYLSVWSLSDVAKFEGTSNFVAAANARH